MLNTTQQDVNIFVQDEKDERRKKIGFVNYWNWIDRKSTRLSSLQTSGFYHSLFV